MTVIKVKPPREDFEAARLVSYLKLRGWRFTHIANETRSKRQAIKNKSLGTSKGVPDYLILHPTRGVVFIELKRLRGGKVSAEQKEWIDSEWRTTDNYRRAKYYRLTPLGRKALGAETQSWRRMVLAVEQLLRTT